jgi:hypothetical protein
MPKVLDWGKSMAQDHQKSWVKLLHQNPDQAFRLLAHELLGHVSFINGYAQLLTSELKRADAETLNVETLQNLNEYSQHIVVSSERAAEVIYELRNEVNQQLSTEEGHTHD